MMYLLGLTDDYEHDGRVITQILTDPNKALDAGGVATHGTNCVFFEADGLAFVGGQEDDLLAVGEGSGDQFVALLDIDGDDAARHHVGKVLEFGFLHGGVAGDEEDVLPCLFEIADCEHGTHGFAGLQGNQVAHVLALSGCANVGDLVDLQPVDTTGVGEDQDVSVGGGDEEVLDEIFVARLHTRAARTTASLHAVG